MKINILIVFCLCCITATAFSQQAAVAAGGEASGADGSVSYSVGQVVCAGVSDIDGAVTTGIQQAYVINVTTGYSENINLNCMAYPNPTVDILYLVTDVEEELEFSLYGSTGNLLISKPIDSKQTEINMSAYKAGVYILKIESVQKEIKTFKILKR